MLEITAKKLPQELQNIAVQNIGRGIETMFVLDDIQYIARVNGRMTTGEAQGFAEDGKVYIKVNNTYTAEQINGHETFHVDAGRYPRETRRLWYNISKVLPKKVMQNVFEQYRKEYSDVYSSAKIIELAREEILADIAGEMNPLSEIPEVREAVGRFYDEIYGKGAGEEFQRGIEGSRYSVRKAAEEPAAFSMGKERDDAAEIMDYFEGAKAEQGREMSLEAMMEDAARSEKGMSAEDADAAAREIMEEMGGEKEDDGRFERERKDGIMNENDLETLFKFIRAEDLNKIVTEKDKAYFWSGNSEGYGGKSFAKDYAENNEGITLEGLVEKYELEMPEWIFGDYDSIVAWEQLSYEYARCASGEITAIIGNILRSNSVWETVELPTLKQNVNVTKITVVDPHTLQKKVIYERIDKK